MLATTRDRLGLFLEWSVAVAFLAATLAVALLILGELDSLDSPAASPSPDRIPQQLPASIPGPAVAVPALELPGGILIRVGDSLDAVRSIIGTGNETGIEAGHSRIGPRWIRSYDYRGARFLLVFEPFERGGSLRVAAIYIR